MVSWLNPYTDHFESERHKLVFQLKQVARDAWAFSKFTLSKLEKIKNYFSRETMMLEKNIIFQVEMIGTVAKHPFKSCKAC